MTKVNWEQTAKNLNAEVIKWYKKWQASQATQEQVATLTDNREAWALLATSAQERITALAEKNAEWAKQHAAALQLHVEAESELDEARQRFTALTNANAILDQAYASATKAMLKMEAQVAALTETMQELRAELGQYIQHGWIAQTTTVESWESRIGAALAAVRGDK